MQAMDSCVIEFFQVIEHEYFLFFRAFVATSFIVRICDAWNIKIGIDSFFMNVSRSQFIVFIFNAVREWLATPCSIGMFTFEPADLSILVLLVLYDVGYLMKDFVIGYSFETCLNKSSKIFKK